jgi:hypothetical protein
MALDHVAPSLSFNVNPVGTANAAINGPMNPLNAPGPLGSKP